MRYGIAPARYGRADRYMNEPQFRRPPMQQFYPHGVTPPGFRGDVMWNGQDGSNGGDDGVDAPGWSGSYWYPEPPIREMPGPRAQVVERNNRPLPGFGGMDNAWYGTAGLRDMGQQIPNGDAAAILGQQWGRGWSGEDGQRERDFSQIFTHPMTGVPGNKGLNLSGMTEEEWDALPQRPYWEDYYPLMNFWRNEEAQY